MSGKDEPADKKIPRPPKEAAGPAPVGEKDDATLEAQQLNRGLTARDLAKEAQEADHDRSEKFKDHFETMALVTVWGLFAVFIVFGAVWAIHMVWPCIGWLTKPELDAIQSLLTGGIIAGLVADHVRRRMG